MSEIFASQEFGVMLTFLAYMMGVFIYQKTKLPIFSPLLVATILLIAYIKIAGIDLATFVTDLSGIHVFLGPLIVSLAVPIISKLDIIKKNFVVIIVGSFVGAVSSMLAVIYIGPLLGIDSTLISSIIPKSSTTPIAIEVSEQLGGIRAITVAVVVLSAVLGAVIIPMILQVFKIKDPRVVGLVLGSTSHAVGTAKAIEIDKEAGAISSVALVFTGVITALMLLFL